MTYKYQGKVTWFNDLKGYGFIECEKLDGPIFVHWKSIDGLGFKTLSEDQTVTFSVKDTPNGPSALNVEKVPDNGAQDKEYLK